MREADLIDVWRNRHPSATQHTWVKVVDGRISAARLDRFYMSASFILCAADCRILPVVFTDHHLVLTELVLTANGKSKSFWHFNVKLLNDFNFCQNFRLFWDKWRSQNFFMSLSQWWEVGKGHIRVFCQQYASYSTVEVHRVMDQLEREIGELEGASSSNTEMLVSKRQQLNALLRERAKGALVQARIASLKDMDAPTSFFFNLERSEAERKQVMCLRLLDGSQTSDPAEIRQHTGTFYGELFAAHDCDEDAVADLLRNLPQLSPEDSNTLGLDLSLEELSSAVEQMAPGKSPGLDGLPSDFFKHFWSVLGPDLLDVFKDCFNNGTLPASCRRAVISLLPKKGELTLIKNWRPVALFMH